MDERTKNLYLEIIFIIEEWGNWRLRCSKFMCNPVIERAWKGASGFIIREIAQFIWIKYKYRIMSDYHRMSSNKMKWVYEKRN